MPRHYSSFYEVRVGQLSHHSQVLLLPPWQGRGGRGEGEAQMPQLGGGTQDTSASASGDPLHPISLGGQASMRST